MDFTIDLIRKLALENNIKWNGHATQRMIHRTISRKQVIDSILYGEIIEEYPTDYPFPSCLILGMASLEEPLHIVCSIGQEKLWIITVYRPDNIKWQEDYKTRKEIK